MRIFSVILLLFFCLAVLTCSKSDDSTKNLAQKSQKQILEITSDFRGLWWMKGQVLDFRRYNDGIVEFDEYPLQNSPDGTIIIERVKITKQVKINAFKLNEILDLLANNEFSKVGKDLIPQKSCIDAFIDTKIKLTSRGGNSEIIVKSHCSKLADSKSTFYFKDFPPSVNNLFEIIKGIKDEESPGKFYN